MKLSFTTMATPEKSAAEAAGLAAKYGYDGVDIRISDKKGELHPDATRQEIFELRDIFKSSGVQIASLFCYNDTGGNDAGSWDKMRDSILRHLEIAELLETNTIRIFGGNPEGADSREEYIKKVAFVLLSVLQRYTGRVSILIQNHVGSVTARDVIEICNEVSSPRFGMAFDPSHCIRMGENHIGTYMNKIKKFTRSLYITDILSQNNSYVNVLPGNGEVDFEDILKKIGGKDFDGWSVFKWPRIWNSDLVRCEVALPHFLQYIHGIGICFSRYS